MLNRNTAGRAVIIFACLALGLAGCNVPLSASTPTSAPTLSPQPIDSPLTSPLATPNPCSGGCLEATVECVIKGVVLGTGERYYYTSDAPGYMEARVLTQFGARWFCTLDDAVASGFQKAPR